MRREDLDIGIDAVIVIKQPLGLEPFIAVGLISPLIFGVVKGAIGAFDEGGQGLAGVQHSKADAHGHLADLIDNGAFHPLTEAI